MPELLEQTSLSHVIDGELTDHFGFPDPLEETPVPVTENPATLAVAETVDVDFTPSHSERPTLRDRFFRSRLGRTALAVAAGIGFAGGASIATAAPAHAESTHTYTVENTDGDGVWLHGDPGLGDKGDLITVVPEGVSVTADCYVNDTPVGEKNNPAWLRITYDSKQGFISDVFTSSRWNRDNTLHDQGLAFCGEEKTPTHEQPSGKPDGEVLVTPIYNREKAATWAREHAEDTPKYRASCTNFVSQALWEGGLPKDERWTSEGEFGRIQKRPGTKAAWSVEHFRNYITSKYPQSDEVELDSGRFKNNRVPEAQIGDVILYDWQNDGSYDHATIVTGIVGDHYPKVSEWSIYDGTEPTRYPERGWTHSEKDDLWLQHPTKYPKVVALLIHIDTEQRGEF